MAGVIQGEGYLGLGKRLMPKLGVEMQDLEVVEQLHAWLGGSLRYRAPRGTALRRSASWEVGNLSLLIHICQEILPYMYGTKAQIVRGMLEAMESKQRLTVKGIKTLPEISDVLHQLFNEARRLNGGSDAIKRWKTDAS